MAGRKLAGSILFPKIQAIDLRDYDERPSRTFVILLQVVQNHQNGRDTHVR